MVRKYSMVGFTENTLFCFSMFFKILILERVKCGGEKEGERNINLLFHSLMPSLVGSCMCPDQGIKPKTLAYWDDTLTN